MIDRQKIDYASACKKVMSEKERYALKRLIDAFDDEQLNNNECIDILIECVEELDKDLQEIFDKRAQNIYQKMIKNPLK